MTTAGGAKAMNMDKHSPNPDTYRPWLGVEVNNALIRLTIHKNKSALSELSASDYLEKMVAHWWKKEFPDEPVPFKTKAFYEDLDFVQSV